MNIIKKILRSIPHLHSVKYILALAAAVIIIGFGGGNSLWAHFRNMSRISELNDEIARYDSEYRRDQAQIRELQSNPKKMERIARERYFMKAADEDIFVLSDDDRVTKGKAPSDETIE